MDSRYVGRRTPSTIASAMLWHHALGRGSFSARTSLVVAVSDTLDRRQFLQHARVGAGAISAAETGYLLA